MDADDLQEQHRKDWYLRSCAGKDPFPTENSAQAYARLMLQGKVNGVESRPGVWLDVRPYACGICLQWHLGHPSVKG